MKLFPLLQKKDIKWVRVFKDKNAGLIYKQGTLANMPKIKTQIKNLYIVGLMNSHPDRKITL